MTLLLVVCDYGVKGCIDHSIKCIAGLVEVIECVVASSIPLGGQNEDTDFDGEPKMKIKKILLANWRS